MDEELKRVLLVAIPVPHVEDLGIVEDVMVEAQDFLILRVHGRRHVDNGDSEMREKFPGQRKQNERESITQNTGSVASGRAVSYHRGVVADGSRQPKAVFELGFRR